MMDLVRLSSSSSSVSADIEMSESESESDVSISIAGTISAGTSFSLMFGRACTWESAEVESAAEDSEVSWDASLADKSIAQRSDDTLILVKKKATGNCIPRANQKIIEQKEQAEQGDCMQVGDQEYNGPTGTVCCRKKGHCVLSCHVHVKNQHSQ